MSAPPLPVVFEDEHLLIVSKPPGLLSVPPSGGGKPNVADRLRRQAKQQGKLALPVHRLDLDTSGLLVFARSEAARDALVLAFRERDIQKRYVALVHGRVRPAKGTIRSYIEDRGKIARSFPTERRGAGLAITRFRVLESFRDATLVEARPETGRLNQIRLHFADRHTPLVGDRKYAVASRYPLRFRRTLLHAAGLSLPHPKRRGRVDVEAPLPDDFRALLESLAR